MDAQKTGPITISTPLSEDLTFHSMGGIEALSQPFAYEVDVVGARSDVQASKLLGQPVTVHLEADEEDRTRHFNGRVTRFEYLETSDDGLSRYRLTLRPWLWQLGLSANCRVWQNLTIPEIVTRVFQERGFHDFESALSDTYKKNDYVVQYRESDLAFVSRLLEREGIYYFFRHEDGRHTLVLGDSPQAHGPAPGCTSLPYAKDDGNRDATMRYVGAWRVAEQLEAGAYAEADFDFTKPRARLYSRAVDGGDDASSQLEVYDYQGGFRDRTEGDTNTRRRLAQARRDACRHTGETNARGLTVGSTFELKEHPREDQNSKYVVVSARYRLRGHDSRSTGSTEEAAFACTFAVIGADETFRPPLVTRRPLAYGPQTATVVGPGGQEIWTDSFGRIKVQFHWDREGQLDENSSCWVRVSQAWAGGRWGAQFVPRIGDEVVLEFLDGDPDRPIVTGSVYNGANTPPFPLPQSQTQSGIRTRSTPGGTEANCNEIRFEDALGNEELFVQAERTQTTVVKASQFVTVGANRTLTVTGADSTSVGLVRTLQVLGANNVTVGAESTETVIGASQLTVGQTRTETITGGLTTTVKQDSLTTISGAKNESVGGNLSLTVSGRVETTNEAETNLTFKDDYTERHKGHRTVIVGTGKAHRSATVHVEGTARVYAAKAIEIRIARGPVHHLRR